MRHVACSLVAAITRCCLQEQQDARRVWVDTSLTRQPVTMGLQPQWEGVTCTTYTMLVPLC